MSPDVEAAKRTEPQLIGSFAPSDTGFRWVDMMERGDVDEPELLFEYATALHWTVAQMTLGAMDVGSTNRVERFFAVVMLIVAW